MKILLLNWYDIRNPMAGGAERYIFEIFSRLAKSHEITMVCQSYPGSQEKETVNGINVIRVPVSDQTLIRRTIWTLIRTFLYCIRFQKEYDIVVDCVEHIPYFTPFYIWNNRIALQFHFIGENFRSEFPKIGWLLEWIEKIYFRLYKFEKFVVISPSTQWELPQYGINPDQSIIIYCGISWKSMLPEQNQVPTLVFLGRLQKYKQVDLLLHAMKIVVKHIPNAKLIIIGDGEERRELMQLTAKLDLNTSVQFTGYVSENQLMKLLSEAWLHINPSRKEGWGLNTFEAARFRIPTVASRVPGSRDVIIDGITGILVDNGDIGKLSEAIISLLQDTSRREMMGELAQEYSQKFNWEDSTHDMEDFLIRLAEMQSKVVNTEFFTSLQFPLPF